MLTCPMGPASDRRDHQHQRQAEPDHRGDEGEGPAPDHVRDLEPEHGVAGDPGAAGERADPDREAMRPPRTTGSAPWGRATPLPWSARHRTAAAAAGPRTRLGPPHMPSARPRNTAAEEHAVGGLAAAEVGDVGAGERDDDTAGGEGADHPDDQPTDERRAPDVLPALHDDLQHVRLGMVVGRPPGNGRQPPDRERREPEGQPVDVQGDVDGASRSPRDAASPATARGGKRGEEDRTAGRAEPYDVARLIWLAAVRRCGGTRFGIVASFAGPQIRLIASTITVTTSTHHKVPTIGIVRNSAPRRTSP